ncbi:MAG: type IV secretion system DNA-binding domain-containing protein, partial [Anaerolineales bacterium]|nr:type IV secretion system DNA-binding domain-containing protein [Anaerolineales bacterium]
MNNLTHWIMGHDEIALSDLQRSTHTYVIGQSGTGKSRALESWIMQDIAAGHGVGVIDPHGDLYNHLMAKLANHPQVWEKIILFDPLD